MLKYNIIKNKGAEADLLLDYTTPLSPQKRFGKTIRREELAENPKGDGGVSKLIC
jgi:hypothetical protein